MRCQRCRVLMVCETFDDLYIETHSRYSARRRISCGCVEDAVIRANRFRRWEGTWKVSRRRVGKGDVVCIKTHPEEYASIA